MKRVQLSGRDSLEVLRIADAFQVEDQTTVVVKLDEAISYQVRGVTQQDPQSGVYRSESPVHIELIERGADDDWSLPDSGVRVTVTEHED
jgi:hypothetical protein